jgi:hypothetical protein
MDDLEGVHKQTAPVDMDSVVKPFFNQMRDTRLMPNDVLNMFKEVASIQRREAEKWEAYAQDIRVHVGAIDILGKSVEELTSVVKEFKVVQKSDDKFLRREKVKKLLGDFGW